jgi:VanZ family protein
MGLSLASSPVGRIHIAEYALLGFLFVRALPAHLDGPPLMALAVAAAALTGLVDETIQHFLPNRVFDWYDVALNGGSALLGVLFSSWWDLTEKLKGEASRGGPPTLAGS